MFPADDVETLESLVGEIQCMTPISEVAVGHSNQHQRTRSLMRRLRSRSTMYAPRHRDGGHASSGGTNAPAPAAVGIGTGQAVGGHAAETHHHNPSPPGSSPCTVRDSSLPRVRTEKAWHAQ